MRLLQSQQSHGRKKVILTRRSCLIVSVDQSPQPANSQRPTANGQQLTANTFTYLYGEIRPIPSFFEYPRGESQISTWIFFIFHVGVIHFFRSFISFLRSFISFLRRIFYSPRGDFKISTWKSVFTGTAPHRYVINSKLLQQPSVEFLQPTVNSQQPTASKLHGE